MKMSVVFLNVVVMFLLIGFALCAPTATPPAPKVIKECKNWTSPSGTKHWKCNTRTIYPTKHWSWKTVTGPDGKPNKIYDEWYTFPDQSNSTNTEVPESTPKPGFTTKRTTVLKTTKTTSTASPNDDGYTDEDYGDDDEENAVTCGKRSPPKNPIGRIVGGRAAVRNEFPWMVGIEYGIKEHSIRGGGAIINKRWILSAAHVFQPDPKIEKYRGLLGVVTLDEAPIYVQFDRIIFHPEYKNLSDNYHNDIALLHTTKEITLYPKREGVNSICLPNESAYGGLVTVAGFGTVDDEGTPAEKLMTVDLKILSDSVCKNQFKKEFSSQIMICAGVLKGGKDSCHGDSGGPMMKFEKGRGYIIGVVSYGSYSMCARKGDGAVYTKVPQYIKWIKDITKEV